MLKALGRATLLMAIIAAIGWGLWVHTIGTLITLAVIIVFGWLTFMLFTDPPEDWD
jgi:hypothetical protein